MVELMIAEEVDDGGPDGVGGGAGNADDAHDIARHGVVDPIDQALINHDPARVGAVAMWEVSPNLPITESKKHRHSW
jgi:hypothetical protein